jgi:hypothetical protein
VGKDLIIGGASNYTWDHLKYWVNSIKRSGFEGDVVLVATNITKETIDKLIEKNVIVSVFGKKDEQGNYVAHSNGAPHVERFFYIWNYINSHPDYEYVISTDTRDVIFQTNPSEVIRETIYHYNLIASGEGIKYADEPWGNNNLLETFGPFFHNLYKNETIYNVGVLAGQTKFMRDLMFMIFQMSINRSIPIVDQAVFNVLLQQEPFKSSFKLTNNDDAWAAQLGVTMEAIKSGSGDIGMSVMNDPTKMIMYQMKYLDKQPKLVDGYVLNDNDKKFCIVHQYDRTHAWKDAIISKYEE